MTDPLFFPGKHRGSRRAEIAETPRGASPCSCGSDKFVAHGATLTRTLRQITMRARIHGLSGFMPPPHLTSFRELIDARFTPEVVAEIATAHGIDAEGTRLEWFLKKSTSYLFTVGAGGRRSDKLQSRYLTKVHKLSNDLLAALQASEGLSFWLDMNEEAVDMGLPSLSDLRRSGREGLCVYFDDLIRSLSILRQNAQRQLTELRPNTGGRPSDDGTYFFADYLYDYWTYELARPFTIDYHQGAGVTPAYAFLSDVLGRVEDFEPQKLVTAMRKVIADHNSHKNPYQD